VQIWAASVNARGGLFGREVKVIVQDDGSDPARYASILQDDVQNQGVVAFVGQGAALTMQGGSDYLQHAGVPVFGSECGRDEWFSSNVYAPQCAAFDVQIIGTIRAGVQLTGKTRLGYVFCGEAASCATNDRVIQGGGAQAAGAQVVYRQQISLTQVDFTAECQNAARANVELMFVSADPNTVSRFWTSCQRQGFHAQSVQIGVSASADSNKLPGVENMIVEMPTFPFAGLSGGAFDEYNNALAAFGETNPGPPTSLGWAAAKLFELAATRAAQSRQSITSATLLEAFHTIDNDNVSGLTAALTFTGQTPTPARCYFVSQGDGNGGWKAPYGADPQCL
jgi:branched-chain amino acid transport system substrate-binding protein